VCLAADASAGGMIHRLLHAVGQISVETILLDDGIGLPPRYLGKL
jgi:hypothetical protein